MGFVEDFQKFLVRRFGCVEDAWSKAFDTDFSGSINFTEFCCGCKMSGYVGNVTRLWAALDDDRSGEISLDELSIGVDPPKGALARTESPCSCESPDLNPPSSPRVVKAARRLSLRDLTRSTLEHQEPKEVTQLPGMMPSVE